MLSSIISYIQFPSFKKINSKSSSQKLYIFLHGINSRKWNIEYCIFQQILILKKKKKKKTFQTQSELKYIRNERTGSGYLCPSQKGTRWTLTVKSEPCHCGNSAASPTWPLQPLLSCEKKFPDGSANKQGNVPGKGWGQQSYKSNTPRGWEDRQSNLILLYFQFLFQFFFISKAISLHVHLTILQLFYHPDHF